MDSNFDLLIVNKNTEKQISKIVNCNEFLNKYGLVLTNNDIMKIVEKRSESLKKNGRIEFGDWIIDKLITAFCDSPYINQNDFSNIINELLDMFYYYKNETRDRITDDELINFMRKYYDDVAHGDLGYLSGTVLEKMRRNVLQNKPMDYGIREKI